MLWAASRSLRALNVALSEVTQCFAMSSSGASPSNEFLSTCEWYAKALLSVTKFHELPRWSDLSLSEDDVEFISSALHVASVEVTSNIDADMCVIWLVQQTRVNHIGNWVVPSLASLVNLSFRGMQTFLQHQSGQQNFRSSEEEVSRRRIGAQWLSECMVAGGLPPLHAKIIAQLPPTEVSDPTELI